MSSGQRAEAEQRIAKGAWRVSPMALAAWVDMILLGWVPLIAWFVTFVAGGPSFASVVMWLSPWTLLAGYFCYPGGHLYTLILYGAVIGLSALMIATGNRTTLVWVVSITVAQSLLAVLGLAFSAMLPMEVEIRNQQLSYAGGRAIFSAVIIGLNVWALIRTRAVEEV